MNNQPIQNRYDFILLFDCINGNPNGDPDAANLPRIDPYTGKCLVTDACIKRKIRNEVALRHEGELGYKMYIQGDTYLNAKDDEAFRTLGILEDKAIGPFVKDNPDAGKQLLQFMCANYFDIRTFGGVMTKFSSYRLPSSIRGPVQISYAESISPVEIREISLARSVVATAAEANRSMNTFGKKFIIPYGLFLCSGSIDATLAQRQTGFSEEDLTILWDGIVNMFEHDAASIRPNMNVRKLIVFKHSSIYGSVPKHKLIDALQITEKVPGANVRSFADYEVTLCQDSIPKSVEIMELV